LQHPKSNVARGGTLCSASSSPVGPSPPHRMNVPLAIQQWRELGYCGEGGADRAHCRSRGRPPPSPLAISTDGHAPCSRARNIPPAAEENRKDYKSLAAPSSNPPCCRACPAPPARNPAPVALIRRWTIPLPGPVRRRTSRPPPAAGSPGEGDISEWSGEQTTAWAHRSSLPHAPHVYCRQWC
jgi:hypothetical protein